MPNESEPLGRLLSGVVLIIDNEGRHIALPLAVKRSLCSGVKPPVSTSDRTDDADLLGSGGETPLHRGIVKLEDGGKRIAAQSLQEF
jgi:hypothetical protein